MMFAQSFLDFGLSEGVLHIVRIIATIGGAVVGWFVCDPLTRLIYRLAYRAATPGPLLFTTKACGAALLGAAMYFIPLGGGGGLGSGPGPGGLPGKGPGPGGNDAPTKDAVAKDAKPLAKIEQKADQARELVDIEILGGKRFKDDGKLRYYHVKQTDATLSYVELRDYFSRHKGKLNVRVVLTPDSASFGSEEDDPTRRLRKLMDQYDQNRDPKSND
jgi:hypothetical protein